MELIVDANILFSALIKNSFTIELIFDEHLKLFTADFIVQEFFKYEKEILKKSHRTREDFIQIMHILQDIITVVPEEEYFKFMKEAEKISPDPKDTMYFALALKLKCGIWSNDKKLKEQTRVNVYSTDQVKLLVKS
jgi:predicted nucleic acid-binding protein